MNKQKKKNATKRKLEEVKEQEQVHTIDTIKEQKHRLDVQLSNMKWKWKVYKIDLDECDFMETALLM